MADEDGSRYRPYWCVGQSSATERRDERGLIERLTAIDLALAAGNDLDRLLRLC